MKWSTIMKMKNVVVEQAHWIGYSKLDIAKEQINELKQGEKFSQSSASRVLRV